MEQSGADRRRASAFAGLHGGWHHWRGKAVATTAALTNVCAHVRDHKRYWHSSHSA